MSNDWLGIEEEEPPASIPSTSSKPPSNVDYVAILRQQQAVAYRQEMFKRQQQQLQAQMRLRNISDQAQLSRQQQLLQHQLQNNSKLSAPYHSPPQQQQSLVSSNHQAQIQKMQFIQQQAALLKNSSNTPINHVVPNVPVVPVVNDQAIQNNIVNSRGSPHIVPSNSSVKHPLVSGTPGPSTLSLDSWNKGYLTFMKNIGKEVFQIPSVYGKVLDLRSFLSFVVELGGYDKVMQDRLPLDASANMAYFYKNLLLDFERRVYPGLSIVAKTDFRNKIGNIRAVEPTDSGRAPLREESSPLPDSPLLSYASPSPLEPTQNMHSSQPPPVASKPQPASYMPKVRKITSFGGYDTAIFDLANVTQQNSISSLGTLDLYRIKMSLKSHLDSDCKYALDALLTISFQSRNVLSIETFTELISALGDLLYLCLLESFGDISRYSSFQRSVKCSYTNLFEIETTQMSDLQEDTYSVMQDQKVILCERALVMSTIFRNFSFIPDYLVYLSKIGSFKTAIEFLLRCCTDEGMDRCSTLSASQAGILEHRKNLITIFSNLGVHLIIPPSSSQLVMNLLEDFLQHSDSVYSYTALEALAKLSLNEENQDSFSSSSNLDKIIHLTAQLLPRDSLDLNSSQETIAQWELASLFIYNLSSTDDDSGRNIIINSREIPRILVRIVVSGISIGQDNVADYIRVITIRALKCIRDCSSLLEFRKVFCLFEDVFVDLMVDIAKMTATNEFRDEARDIIMKVLDDQDTKGL